MTTDLHLTRTATSKAHNRRIAIIAATLVAGLLGSGALVLRGTEAAFTSNVSNGSNQWTAASLSITSDLGATVMYKPTDAKMLPGTPVERCIEIRYTGDVAVPVKLFTSAISDPDGLGSAIDLKVEQGTGTAGINCAGFTEDAVGGGYTGDLYTGTIAGFGAAKNSFANSVTAWTTPASAQNKIYRFTATLQTTAPDTLQGKTLNASFSWQAQAGS